MERLRKILRKLMRIQQKDIKVCRNRLSQVSSKLKLYRKFWQNAQPKMDLLWPRLSNQMQRILEVQKICDAVRANSLEIDL